MATKMTDKQKEQFYRKRRNLNFQSSAALDDLDTKLVELTDEQVLERLAALRRHYER
ncbi:YhfG family protein [Rouxiella badensis]|jgi:hypothetical protein|uniref:YhfG family protein n=1 Tax=Rouxiella badensis TaxID=1646377 RepID=UPI00036A6085|nr:YhfG family protein [Rouxiella badensis]QII40417.1 DUF2559 family protein [Rouxiella badensis]WAT08499.1 YhfG family protein [Rouxiella badensis]